jgi:flagellar assembly protein FliH
MVVKAKSTNPEAPLKNVVEYDKWDVPDIDTAGSNVFRQPVEEEVAEEEETEQLISAEELHDIKEKAKQEGFAAGRREGLESGKTELDNNLLLLKTMMQQISEPLQQVGQETEQEILEMAFAIARQIVRRELKQDPSQLIAIIRDALKLLPIGSTNVQILLNPEDASVVANLLSIDAESQEASWKLINEPSMEKGGCVLKSDNSKVDASIDRQVALLFSRVAGGQRAGEDDDIG